MTSLSAADTPGTDFAARLNWLRAGVLGANDGIVSTAALVVGVAGAAVSTSALLAAGVAGVVAGAVSMGLGEYVSVSSQRDAERALLDRERAELAADPEGELDELTDLYRAKGLTAVTARAVAEELTALDPFAAHVDAELHLRPDALTNPWHAAIASAASFVTGAVLPLAAILLPPAAWRVPVTFVSVVVMLAVTGTVSAMVGEAPARRATVRVVFGGLGAMVVTYAIGRLIGFSGV